MDSRNNRGSRTRSAHRAQANKQYNNKQSINKLPPYGKNLLTRQQYNNLPFLVIICIGANAWQSAKQWQQRPKIAPLMLPPDQPPEKLTWPVKDCLCIVDWDAGAPESLIIKLVKCLLSAGALSVSVRPLFVDLSTPDWLYDLTKPTGNRWVQVRETMMSSQYFNWFPPQN